MPKVEEGYLLDDSGLMPYGKPSKSKGNSVENTDIKTQEEDDKGKKNK